MFPPRTPYNSNREIPRSAGHVQHDLLSLGFETSRQPFWEFKP